MKNILIVSISVFSWALLASTNPNKLELDQATPYENESETHLYLEKEKPGAFFGRTTSNELWKVTFSGPMGFSPQGSKASFQLETLQKLHSRYTRWLNGANPPAEPIKSQLKSALGKVSETVLGLKRMEGECHLYKLADSEDKYVQLEDGQFVKLSMNGKEIEAHLAGKITSYSVSQVPVVAMNEFIAISVTPKQGFKHLFDGPHGHVYGEMSDGSKRYLSVPANKSEGLLVGTPSAKGVFVPEDTINEWASWLIGRFEKDPTNAALLASVEGASTVLLHHWITQFENTEKESSPLVYVKGTQGYKYYVIKKNSNPSKKGALIPVKQIKIAEEDGEFDRHGKTIAYNANTMLVDLEHMSLYTIKSAIDLRKKDSIDGIDTSLIKETIQNADKKPEPAVSSYQMTAQARADAMARNQFMPTDHAIAGAPPYPPGLFEGIGMGGPGCVTCHGPDYGYHGGVVADASAVGANGMTYRVRFYAP